MKNFGEFTVAGVKFKYEIRDGQRFINDMPAQEFMKTLPTKTLLAILTEAISKDK